MMHVNTGVIKTRVSKGFATMQMSNVSGTLLKTTIFHLVGRIGVVLVVLKIS